MEPEMIRLNQTELRVFTAILQLYEKGMPPTLREITRHIHPHAKLTYVSLVVNRLLELGFIDFEPFRLRTIRPLFRMEVVPPVKPSSAEIAAEFARQMKRAKKNKTISQCVIREHRRQRK